MGLEGLLVFLESMFGIEFMEMNVGERVKVGR